MKKLIGIVALATVAGLVGCDEKKPSAPKAGDTKGAADAGKGMMDKAKEAGKDAVDKGKEMAKDAADKAKEGLAAMRDKAVDALKPQYEAAKGKLDELAKKVDGLDAIKKAAASPLLDTAKKAFTDLTSKFDALKTTTDGWEKAKETAEGSLKTFNDAAGKLGDMLK